MISDSLESFSISLLKTLIKESKDTNIFSSPLSIMTAFSMLLMGAEKESKEQLIKTLKFKADNLEQLHQSIGGFIEKCIPEINKYDDTKLSIANGLFIQQNFQINDQYKSNLLDCYKIEIRKMNFESPTAVNEVNQWIENKTNEKIKNMFQEGAFNSLTKLVLANSVYFKSGFKDPFPVENTKEKLFFLNSNSKHMVQMMQTGGDFNYVENRKLGLKALSIPFKNFNFRFVLVLPMKRFDLDDALTRLNETDLKHLVSSLELRIVSKLEIPKFKIETTIDLRTIMTLMESRDIFDPEKANLSGISDSRLFVDKAIHKTFLDVNEHGVEAAAATALSICLMSMPFYVDNTPVEFVADEPFLLIVYHNPTDSIIFLGRISNP